MFCISEESLANHIGERNVRGAGDIADSASADAGSALQRAESFASSQSEDAEDSEGRLPRGHSFATPLGFDPDEDDEMMLFRGMSKQKQKHNDQSFAPLVSPYIHLGQDSAVKSESAEDSRSSSTVMDAPMAEGDDSRQADVTQQVPIDEDLYEQLDELDREEEE